MVRGGYGIFYKEWNEQDEGIPQTGFSITPQFQRPNAGLTPAFYWDGGFPQNFNHPPLISPTVANGQVASVVDPKTGGTAALFAAVEPDHRAADYPTPS